MCRIEERYDKNVYLSVLSDLLEKTDENLATNNIEEQEAQALLDMREQLRKEYLEAKPSKNLLEGFSPSPGLPEDSVLVVRTEALRDFENSLSRTEESRKKTDSLPESERNSLLKLVYGLAHSTYDLDPGTKRQKATGENRGSIHAELSRLGLNLDADTIRKFIKEAEERFGDLIPKPDNS